MKSGKHAFVTHIQHNGAWLSCFRFSQFRIHAASPKKTSSFCAPNDICYFSDANNSGAALSRMHVWHPPLESLPVARATFVRHHCQICARLELRLKANKPKTMSNPDGVKITYTDLRASAHERTPVCSVPRQIAIARLHAIDVLFVE